MDPITIGNWLATLGIVDFLLDRLKNRLVDAPENRAVELLKRFIAKRDDRTIPANDDLEQASNESLREATRALLLGIQVHLDPKPSLFEAIGKHLRDGTLTAQPSIELRQSPSRKWVNALEKLCNSETSFARLTRKTESVASDRAARRAAKNQKDTARELHRIFGEWLDREMQGVEGRPEFLDNFLQNGWPIEADRNERVTLYQAWCLFFREKIKNKTEVFRILVADTVTETASEVKELRALVEKQTTPEDFHRWMGLHIGALQDWITGQFNRVNETLGDHTTMLRKIDAQTTKPEPPKPKGKPRNLPFGSIGELFKGRADDIAKIQTALKKNRPVVIHGLGGVGKTRLATEYALRHRDNYCALLSVSADVTESLINNVAALCTALNLPEEQPEEQNTRYRKALRWLKDNSGWILILDKADTREAVAAVEKLLPSLNAGHVIVTSRVNEWNHAVETLPLHELSPEAAVEYLLHTTLDKRASNTTDQTDAAALAKVLGYLALGLEQAAAYIETKRISFAAYHERWCASEENIRYWHSPLKMQYDKSVAVTWDTSFAQLSPFARALLHMLCWLAPAAISRAMLETTKTGEILRELVANAGNAERLVEDALAELACYSLLKWHEGSSSISIHPLLAQITQDHVPQAEHKAILQGAFDLVTGELPYGYGHAESHFGFFHRLFTDVDTPFPHLASIARGALRTGTPLDFGRLVHLLREANLLEEASLLAQLELEVGEKVIGKDNEKSLINLKVVAQILQDIGHYKEALSFRQRAIATSEKINARSSRELIDMALVFKKLKNFSDAENCLRRALAIDEKFQEKGKFSIARDCNNLSQILLATGRPNEAEQYLRRAIDITEAAENPFDLDSVAAGVIKFNLARHLRTLTSDEEVKSLIQCSNRTLTRFSRSLHHDNGNLGAERLAYQERIQGLDFDPQAFNLLLEPSTEQFDSFFRIFDAAA